MQVERTNSEGLKHEFKVTIPAADIQARTDKRLAELAKQARLPGFRPGKVPMSYMRQRFGQSIRGEILEQAVNESSQQALTDHNIRPAQEPKIELTSAAEDDDVEFTVSVEHIPEFDLGDVESLELERLRVEVPDSEVDRQLARLAERNRDSTPVAESRPAADGDMVVLDFQGYVDGQANENLAASDQEVELGAGQLVEGFDEQLVGAEPGERRQVTVTFPADHQAAEVAGKAVTFDVTVKELRTPQPQPVDDSLAEKLGLDDLASLKDLLRQQVEQQYQNSARAVNKRRLLDKLAERYTFDVPEGMVDNEFESIWSQLDQQREQGQLSVEDQAKSEDELRDEYRQIARRRVRLGLVLAEIGRRNNIQVSQDELNQAVAREAQNHPGQEKEVFDYFRQNEQAMEQLRAPLLEDKVVDFLLANANVEERAVDPDTLQAEQEKLDSLQGTV